LDWKTQFCFYREVELVHVAHEAVLSLRFDTLPKIKSQEAVYHLRGLQTQRVRLRACAGSSVLCHILVLVVVT